MVERLIEPSRMCCMFFQIGFPPTARTRNDSPAEEIPGSRMPRFSIERPSGKRRGRPLLSLPVNSPESWLEGSTSEPCGYHNEETRRWSSEEFPLDKAQAFDRVAGPVGLWRNPKKQSFHHGEGVSVVFFRSSTNAGKEFRIVDKPNLFT